MGLFQREPLRLLCTTTVTYTTRSGRITQQLANVPISVEPAWGAELDAHIKAAIELIVTAHAPPGTTSAHYGRIVSSMGGVAP